LFIVLWVEVLQWKLFVDGNGDVPRHGLHRRVRIGWNGEPVIGEPVGGLLLALLEVLQNPVLAFDGVGGALVISLLKLLL
jgi:hypothetical protein